MKLDELEIWKLVKGYEQSYMVSDLGRVKSLDRFIVFPDGHKQSVKGQILKPMKNSNGYHFINLMKNSKKKICMIHRLVTEAFIGCSDKQVNHIDKNKTNNKLENLEYVSKRENLNHAFNGKFLKGVNKVSPYGRYASRVTINKKQIHLGYFDTQIEAHNAYIKEVNKLKENKYSEERGLENE